MSSRKKKREKRAQANESEASSTPEVESSEGEASQEAVEAETEPVDEAEAPAVSEISELKPRGKKRKRAPEPEPEPEASSESEHEEEEEDEEDDGPVDESAKEAPKTRAHLKRVIESLIFVSDQVITAQQLGRITKTKIGDVREVLAELAIEYEGRGLELVEVNGGYQFRSAAASAPYVRVLVAARPVRLTRAQLETLALIAYRQPITRPEVDDVRGVDSGSAIKVLLDRELIKILGRKDDAGRPLLYGTTPFFLEFFGMNSMQELPTLREFTELSDEHRELFKAKTNDIGDPSAEAEVPLSVSDFASDDNYSSESEPDAAAEGGSEQSQEPRDADETVEAEASEEPLDAEASDELVESEPREEQVDAEASDDVEF
ncbi:MAG TPA: SMC-Scp complex subunit ScpB, partial [Polyangiales bacterium]|nr:SMC-Scp complex subunit ScpB [Polyangiales bacterium]